MRFGTELFMKNPLENMLFRFRWGKSFVLS